MKEILKNRILKGYQNFLDLEKIIKEKNTEITQVKEKISSENLSTIEEKADLYKSIYIDFTFLINDSKINFSRLFFDTDLYKELGFDDLPPEIVEFYNKNRFFAPKEIFIIKDGVAIEREEGILSIEREKFMNSDFFTSLMNIKKE
jgi:hypothetical protein